MRELVKRADGLVGKTIDKVYDDIDKLWMSFTDGTAAIIGVFILDEDSGEPRLETRVSDDRLIESFEAAAIMCSDKEVAALREKKEAKDKAKREYEERTERQQYEKLKARFEPNGSNG